MQQLVIQQTQEAEGESTSLSIPQSRPSNPWRYSFQPKQSLRGQLEVHREAPSLWSRLSCPRMGELGASQVRSNHFPRKTLRSGNGSHILVHLPDFNSWQKCLLKRCPMLSHLTSNYCYINNCKEDIASTCLNCIRIPCFYVRLMHVNTK